MSLTPFTGTTSATTLNANFDDATATITAQADDGAKDQTVHLYLASLASGADLSVRSVAFTMQDDMEVRVFVARVTDTGVRAISASVEVENGDSTFLSGYTMSLSVTTAAGTVDTRPTSLDLRTATGRRIRLLRGVRYRMAFQNTSGGTVTGPLQLMLQLRTVRRRS
jgi:hypothetical protein